ncbi:LysR family transcriptional regulator [Pseudomonas sp. GD03842]|uniref:LysR family transcriptional regulator n=1 Tax=unclassified Pseudomonas TaxID=196821 RepID=UPI000D39B7DD|nr:MULTISPECIES: LysR family transcriptional regulator [unclassified Pseudomonas]MDH0746954.1 LysR family transcriptional regulator [Pseudomonas sp. GD03842]RAU43807.1 LysR family transcriptional regulator [Pseudomonas sp. RIT 409]RAU56299.1 LysR family transcriptional regulator [Pseudomonas sp. RIT 412]
MSFDGRLASGMGVLSAVVDSGSFVNAARALDMTQSGVSRAVARLEARLGIRLFDRTTRSVTLTAEGRQLYEEIAPLLAGLEEAATMASGSATTVRGRLRVNVDPYFSRVILAPALGSFMETYPEIELDLFTREQLGDLVAEGVDLAVRFGEQPDSSLIRRLLLKTRVLTVASPAYLQKHGHPQHPTELEHSAHVCVEFRNPQTGKPFTWEFHRGAERLTVKTHGRLMVNDVGTMHRICEEGQGVAQVLELGVEAALREGRLIELFADWPDEYFPLYALYPSRHLPPAKVRAFLEFVVGISQ